MKSENYFELKITIPPSADQLHTKAAILSLLECRDLPFVEEIVDGIETSVDAINWDEKDRVLPLAVYFKTFVDAENFLRELQEEFPVNLESGITEIEGQAWSSAWRSDFEIIETDRFIVFPEGSTDSTLGKIPIYIREGVAFGNGQHATTEACLHAIENFTIPDNFNVLDVGTGTGILSIVFAKLGCHQITGTEISTHLVDEALSNLKLNDSEAKVVETEHLTKFESASFSLVIANILVPVLLELMDDMVRVLKPGGILALSGFIEKEATLIRKEMSDRGFVPKSKYDVRGWKALTFEKAISV